MASKYEKGKLTTASIASLKEIARNGRLPMKKVGQLGPSAFGVLKRRGLIRFGVITPLGREVIAQWDAENQ